MELINICRYLSILGGKQAFNENRLLQMDRYAMISEYKESIRLSASSRQAELYKKSTTPDRQACLSESFSWYEESISYRSRWTEGQK